MFGKPRWYFRFFSGAKVGGQHNHASGGQVSKQIVLVMNCLQWLGPAGQWQKNYNAGYKNKHFCLNV